MTLKANTYGQHMTNQKNYQKNYQKNMVKHMRNQKKNVNLNQNEIGLSTIRMAKTRKTEDTMYCESQRLLSLSCIPVKSVNSIIWEKL